MDGTAGEGGSTLSPTGGTAGAGGSTLSPTGETAGGEEVLCRRLVELPGREEVLCRRRMELPGEGGRTLVTHPCHWRPVATAETDGLGLGHGAREEAWHTIVKKRSLRTHTHKRPLIYKLLI